MEAKFIGLLSFISMFLVINAESGENLPEREIASAIYYGDSNVNNGDPFKITCIISISEPISWVKDGEPITKHNLRHWRDEHSFITSESAIEGEKHKIEAHISVRHALKAHQGKYQCNSMHTSFHMLKVHHTENSFTRVYVIDSSEISISTPLTESSSLPSATDLFTVSNTIHQGIPPHTSTTSISSRNKDIPLHKLINVYSNASNFNSMYTISDEVPSVTWRDTTNTDRERHRNVFDKNNVTSVLLVRPSSFPVNPEYVQMITGGRMVEQPSPTEPISTRPYSIPVLPGPATYNKPTTIPKPIVKESELLVPNYDNVEHRLKAFHIRMPLVLHCNITKEGDYDLVWEKNGTEVSKVDFLQGRYRIIKPERKFIIEKTDEKDAGTYSCRVNNEKKDFVVADSLFWFDDCNMSAECHYKYGVTGQNYVADIRANVVVRVPSNSGVVEGEKLSIHCIVVGTDPKLYWETGNLTMYNTTGRYVLKEDENHVKNAVLSMENVSLDDRGEYKCLARNIITDLDISEAASDATYVRVKGKLAALWPFLGICAEVLILCTIILIYEKRRNKTELEESDTDPNTEQ